MLSAKNLLNTSSAGLLSVLLAGTIWIGAPSDCLAKSKSHKKNSSDNVLIAALDSGSTGGEASAEVTPESSGKSKKKLAKKEKESKSDKSDKKDEEKKPEADKAAEGEKEKAAEKDAGKKEKAPDKKAEKADAKAPAKAEEKKSGGGGFFGMGGKKPAPAKKGDTAAGNAAGSKAAKPQEEDPTKPKYKFDPALISVLKDINKSLKDSEAVTKLEDPAQKLVAKLAGQALDKALAAPDLHANRILESKDKARMESSMSAEAWDSGVIDVSPELKASVVVLWAKKIEGLMTVQIVGDYSGKIDGTERKLGEFIAVITAHSSVDKGFDIQSQQDVNFWIGKVVDLKIDCCGSKEASEAQGETKSFLMLTSPITARRREFFAALKEWEEKKLLAQKAEEEKKKQEELQAAVAAKQKEVAEDLAKKVAEALMKQAGNKAPEVAKQAAGGTDGEKKSDGSQPGADSADSKTVASDKKDGDGDKTPVAEKTESVKTTETPSIAEAPKKPLENSAASTPTPAAGTGNASATNHIATLFPDAKGTRSSWDSPAAPAADRAPSLNSSLIYPARAVAGQYITVAVINEKNQGDQYVGLSFNGAQISTGENGKVVFQIPEDAPPGYSLSLSMTQRPDIAASAIEVLQPLATPSSPQLPNLESVSPVVGGHGYLTIGGHNFDGIAERNRVIIDGTYDANVVVSSPVQLKAQLPPGIPPGQHSVCVATAGLRSNPGQFDLVTVDLAPSGPDTPKNDLRKLMVKVQGTQNKVRVKLVNQSRDVIKMLKGDELVVVTSGGAANQVIVPVQRLRWGNYKIDAEIMI